ncbi:MAG: glycosyltransferase family 9 protein [Pseudomonadota bacterium]|nr:glycosyltransferase family 9 protein [Pseudomonadota bacterium]
MWESESNRLLRIVAAPKPTVADWSFQFSAEELETAQKLLSGIADSEDHIAFSIGAKLPDKDWGNSNWTQVLSAISERYPNLGLVSVGSEEDRLRTEHVSGAWAGPRVNLCGVTEPRISALVMRHAAFYLGHDSGPMHLAALAGTRCVAVFSARAKPGVWFPHGNDHKIFYPWELADQAPAKAGFRTAGQSILKIEPSEVIRETISLLEGEAN